jgi:hypothetical protein
MSTSLFFKAINDFRNQIYRGWYPGPFFLFCNQENSYLYLFRPKAFRQFYTRTAMTMSRFSNGIPAMTTQLILCLWSHHIADNAVRATGHAFY